MGYFDAVVLLKYSMSTGSFRISLGMLKSSQSYHQREVKLGFHEPFVFQGSVIQHATRLVFYLF